MEYLSFSLLSEADFDEVIIKAGGRRYTDDLDISELNCDYILEDTVIELKIIEEEPIEKKVKQEKIAKLFRSDIKTVILNPQDLDHQKRRKYYQELAAPIKGHLKKASKQLKRSSAKANRKVKIAIIMNNGLTMTSPEEFERLALERTQNDTTGIDILIVCGMYYFSDKFDSFTFFEFKDHQIQGENRCEIIENLREKWFDKVSEYMTKQLIDLNIKRTKEPIQDLFFEFQGIRYIKPTIQWGKPSQFYGKAGRPREDTTGFEKYPPVATVLPIFDDESYRYAKKHILDDSLLADSLEQYKAWAENERISVNNPYQPLVLITITRHDLETLDSQFSFGDITNLALPKFQSMMLSVIEKSIEFPEKTNSFNYILLQVNEIGMDKANDISFISYNQDNYNPPKQEYLIMGERIKYEYGIALASAHCLSLNAEIVYCYRNEDFKWK